MYIYFVHIYSFVSSSCLAVHIQTPSSVCVSIWLWLYALLYREIGCPKYTSFAFFLGFCFHISPQMIHANDPLTQARNPHTHTHTLPFIYRQAHTQRERGRATSILSRFSIYGRSGNRRAATARSLIRQTSCYKNNIRKEQEQSEYVLTLRSHLLRVF